MHDWKEEIRSQMARLNLPADTREEIIAELASHLEESENANLETLAFSRRQWQKLARTIYRAKREDRMDRKKSLWVPMFVNLLLTSALINICDWLGMLDLQLYRTDHIPFTPQPWLVVLPICGAVAAFLARNGEGSVNERMMAAVAPSVVWVAVPFVLEFTFLCFPHTMIGIPLRSLVLSSIWLFVFTGFPLLLGATPFLRKSTSRRQSE